VNEETYGNYSCTLTEIINKKICGINTIYTDKLTTRITRESLNIKDSATCQKFSYGVLGILLSLLIVKNIQSFLFIVNGSVRQKAFTKTRYSL
jgi:hypothetical protein